MRCHIRSVCTWCALIAVLAAAVARADDDSIPLPGMSSEGEKSIDSKLSGYLENTGLIEYLRGEEETVVLNSTRARLDLAISIGRSWTMGATLISLVYTGDREIDYLGYLPDRMLQQVQPNTRPFFRSSYAATDTFIQEAFVDYSNHGFGVRVGRHKFYSGAGYAFNPIDLFNTKDPLDPTYEIDGLDAAIVRIGLPGGSMLEAVTRFHDDRNETDEQLRLSTRSGRWELAFQATRVDRTRTDFGAMAAGEILSDYRRAFDWQMIAAEFVGEAGGVGVHGEAGWVDADSPRDAGSLKEVGDDHLRLLVGVDYTLESQLYLIAEYVHLGQGRTSADEITINDRLGYLAGEVLAINRDTLYLGASYPPSDLIDTSIYTIIDANTSSVLLNPWVVWNIRPGFVLSASATVPVGGESGSYGELGPSAFARARWSF